MNKTWSHILCRFHNEWVAIVTSFGEAAYAEDIVQEMYIRIHDSNAGEKCITNGEPNRAFIWVVLKNTFITYQKEKAKVSKVDINEIKNISYLEEDRRKHESYDIIRDKIQKEIQKWHPYDQQLFNIYSTSTDSMRDISKGANISLSSIFNTIKNCKARIKNAVGEDYEDYLNEDFDYINMN
jgi:DNA-directed RNA polymerase specialized sigma24 family protein